MLELITLPDLKSWSRAQRSAGRRIGLVPTMGYLHEGHLALVDEAKRRADVVILSIFVNPLQFGPTEDLARYPRDLPRDRAMASARGVDAIFVPTKASMYPTGSEVRLAPGPIADRWEGAARPGHFIGVLTVVAKLFHLVEPDLACFGQKDIQQLTLIRRMVQDLDFPVEIVAVPTVREPDGLALSSRNAYLGTEDRRRAVVLSRALQAAHETWRGGETRATALEARMRQELGREPAVTVEYISIADPDTLAPVEPADQSTVVALAARIGSTRLIDNIKLGEGIR
ncbi:MAG: pantoate--beta-alanine ligase [Gemmatimonadales bacterium]|jgi:pantoate--beta-alanine ligase|nr:pantoate--beta-alanine ligase [Gemmatimonadales bacterium]